MKRNVNRIAVVIAAATLGLSALACGKKEEKPAAQSQASAPALPPDVQSVSAVATGTTPSADTGATGQTAEGENRPVVAGETILATGEFVSPVRSELAVKMPGRVGRMYVSEGQPVSRGEALLELETDYIRLNLQRANADVARAVAAQADARREFERKKDLLAKGSVPQATYDRAQSAMEQADAGLQAARASADLLRQQLSDAVLRSPIDGVIAEKRTDVGQRLGDSSVAFVVAQTAPLRLRFRVPERYLPSLRRGSAVTAAVDAYPGADFAGVITMIGGVVDSQTRSVLVESEFPNKDRRLRPGMFARVTLKAE